MSRLILASRSPRRSELLKRTGIPFEVFSSEIDETCAFPPDQAVCEISLRKGHAAARLFPDSFILSADTLVSFDGLTLGKPKSREQAAQMLRMLSGNRHQVFTGVTVIAPSGRTFTDFDRTDVFFSEISEEEIRSYIISGEPMDKAGSYAIQGRASLWIRRIDGNDSNVIGLPLCLVRRLLLESGFPLLKYLCSPSVF